MKAAPSFLDDQQIERLSELLDQRAVPFKGFNLEALDGYLSALVVAPTDVPAAEWQPAVWGKPPRWADEAERADVEALLQGHWNMASQRVRFDGDDLPEHLAPLLWLPEEAEAEHPDELDVGRDWAFGFFRGQPKVQARLKRLIDVGLDYVQLGQGANTLSSGEAQRLKLAGYLSGARRNRTLFLLDEPTTGLHFADVVTLLDCFEALLAVGHSLIVVEHNLQLMKAADYLIDLGPGAADLGGRVVAKGTPEEVAACAESVTGTFLAEALLGYGDGRGIPN